MSANGRGLPQRRPPFSVFVDHAFGSSWNKPTDGTRANVSKEVEISELKNTLWVAHQKNTLKAFLRDGGWAANHDIRGSLWHYVAAILHPNQAGMYSELKTQVQRQTEKSVPGFVEASHMNSYHLTAEGTAAAGRIVAVLAFNKPDITFCPLLYPLTCILLHYMEEEDCYNCVYSLLCKGQTYLMQTRKAYKVSKGVLMELAKSYAKSFYQLTMKSETRMEQIVEPWLWWIFDGLPFEYLVRVIDCFLLEGNKVLYRVALAILITYQKETVKASPKKAAVTEIDLLHFCKNIPVSPEKLLKRAFKIRGLSRKEIAKLTIKTQMYMDSLDTVEQARRESDKLDEAVRSVSLDDLTAKQALKAAPADQVDAPQLMRTRSRSHGGIDMPLITVQSEILVTENWQNLWGWIPRRYTVCQPHLLFTTSEHGTSLTTFFHRVEGYEPTILVIKTTTKEVFGAFCSTDWEERKGGDLSLSYFGTGESFVFQLAPCSRVFPWVGASRTDDVPRTSSLFMSGDLSKLSVGGGGGEAIQLDANCYDGWTSHSDTFNNPPFVEGNFFRCAVLEVFSLQ